MKMEREFRAIAISGFRGCVHSRFDSLDFLSAISHPSELLASPEARILLDARNKVGVVPLPTPDGMQDFVVKEFIPRGFNRLKSIFLRSKAAKAWNGAVALIDRSLSTPFPAAFLERRKAGFVESSYFISERVSDAEEIRHLLRLLPPSDLLSLLSALGRHLSRCHDMGILHRDLSDGNILVKKDDSGNFAFFLLDTNRIRIRKKIRRLHRIKNLIRLGVPPPFQAYFLEQYAAGPPKRLWRLWYRLTKGMYTWYVGAKKKLRLRQIARKLKIQ